MAMISHKIVARHAKLFQLRLERLLDDWAEDIDHQRILIQHRYSDEDYPEPIATMELDRETQLRDRVRAALDDIFEAEHWPKL